jgi:Thiol-disulfide isomerase and thioredoxins
MSRSAWCIILLLVSPICLYGNDGFKLHGKLNKAKDGDLIMLFTFRDNKIYTVDTTSVKDHNFVFSGKEYLDDFSIITYGNYPDTVWSADVILERGNIYVEIGMEDVITGTLLNESYQSFKKSEQPFIERINHLRSLYREKPTNDSIQNLLKENWENWQQYKATFIKVNISNLLGKRVFIDNNTFFSKEIFYTLYTLLPASLKEDPHIIDAVNDRKKDEDIIVEREKSVEQKIVDFELTDIDGSDKWISEIVSKSKYLYIDFWASWCAPCIAEVPHLKEIYQKYNDKGFEILGISIDTNRSSWKAGLKRIDTPWVHLVDSTGGEDLMKEYKFRGVPYGLLVDNTGRIIEVGLRGEQLDIILPQLFR